MAVTWNKTKFLGVRYREHKSRKHGIIADRCYSIRYKLDGKDKEEVAGWSSEGMSAEKAFKLLSTIRDNIRVGIEPKSFAGIREANEEQAKEAQREDLLERAKILTYDEFWTTEYLPSAESTKKFASVRTEKLLFERWISPSIGKKALKELDTRIIDRIMAGAQKNGKSPATIRYILAVCSQIWNKALTLGLVDGENPVRRVKKPRQDNKRMRFLTLEEAHLLLEALKKRSPDLYQIALLSLSCGLRAGEIHSLTWGDVNFDGGTLFIRDTKNKESRHAFMTKDIEGMLKTRALKSASKAEFVFPSRTGGKRRGVSDTFERTVKKLGLNNTGVERVAADGRIVAVEISDARQRIVFHSLRHTFASWLVQNGTPLYTVAKLMGHSTLEMTQRYSHLTPDTLRKATLSLEDMLMNI
ncbi:tyrosine-type recombinase/integrase [Desulfovibrio desulfuricans]|uniref:tyrosine-type recombinase/integrase n=1 Tax=Desulfovibrio desulfuricans TaxID=876 RepID=UPI001AE1E689|nr:site-specific integrase [Desulfovibrio desulfuricans]QTO41360.1 tyrosine-type recombinase/integrase [Desulfovibrio desulfuricans]